MNMQNPDRVEYQDGNGCPKCGELTERVIIGGHPVHYARVECAGCGNFLKWKGKPNEKSEIRKRSAKLTKDLSPGYCQLCLRLSEQLPVPQTIEAHHVIPVEHGGADAKENIWILCTSCHRLVHHQRTYLGHAFEQFEEKVS